MNHMEENEPEQLNNKQEAAVEQEMQPSLLMPADAQSAQHEPAAPETPGSEATKSRLKENTMALAVGALIVTAAVLFALGHVPHVTLPTATETMDKTKQSAAKSNEKPPSDSGGPLPTLTSGHAGPGPTAQEGKLSPEEIAHTASTPQKNQATPASLGGVRPFESGSTWEPPPFQPGTIKDAGTAGEARSERDALDKPSLVFVRNGSAETRNRSEEGKRPDIEWGIGLAPGTKLRARLESAVNTAVQTPVIAVIAYNYEQDGEIVVPAGAKALGRLETADRSGYLAVRFDSLLLPDGSTVKMEAVATDLELRPLKGKVEGKNTGKNILVRSMTGLGEIAAMVVGRSGLNQPLSEGDLLRERVGTNIGQAGDEQVSRLAVTQHIVVSEPAGMEIYVVLQKSAKTATSERPNTQASSNLTSPSVQELRQLLQLQRELNQSVTSNSTD